jgi:hypothetical protein
LNAFGFSKRVRSFFSHQIPLQLKIIEEQRRVREGDSDHWQSKKRKRKERKKWKQMRIRGVMAGKRSGEKRTSWNQ